MVTRTAVRRGWCGISLPKMRKPLIHIFCLVGTGVKDFHREEDVSSRFIFQGGFKADDSEEVFLLIPRTTRRWRRGACSGRFAWRRCPEWRLAPVRLSGCAPPPPGASAPAGWGSSRPSGLGSSSTPEDEQRFRKLSPEGFCKNTDQLWHWFQNKYLRFIF